MEEALNEIKKLGYTEEDYNKIINNYSLKTYKIVTLIKNIKQIYELFENYGYSKEEILKMTKTLPGIYSLSIENIKEKIEEMKKLGYSQGDIIKMTKTLPSIYGYSIDSLKEKIKNMNIRGYSMEEILKMTKKTPTIYSASIENLSDKLEFYNSIGMHEMITEKPMNLIQSTQLTYARYMLWKEKGVIIDNSNYNKLLYNDSEKKLGISKEQLLEKYSYEKYKQEKSVQELGKETINEQNDVEKKDYVLNKIVRKMEKLDITKEREEK